MRTIYGLCCLLLIATAATGQSTNLSRQIDVRFGFQEKAVTLHEPIVLLFGVHNGMKQPITLTVGSLARQFFDLKLTTPTGKVFHKDPFNGQVDIVTIGDGKVIIAPGADYKETLVMNQWFPFESQGTYSLTSKLTSNIETADGDFQVESQTTQLLINSRDPARLAKICEDLATQVETAANAEAAQGPARKLSYIQDPIAVPYLVRVLSTNTLTYSQAIGGLERIGDVGAAEALLSVVDKGTDVGEQARRSLTRMQDRIVDPRLKDTVRKAVERSSERARNEFIKTQIAYLDYRSPTLQHTAIQNLMKTDGGLQQAAPMLQRLVNDPNQPTDVRAAAKEALQKLHASDQNH